MVLALQFILLRKDWCGTEREKVARDESSNKSRGLVVAVAHGTVGTWIQNGGKDFAIL